MICCESIVKNIVDFFAASGDFSLLLRALVSTTNI